MLLLLLQAYANNHTGNAKINRLVFISEKTADVGLALSALRIAAEDLKKVRACRNRSDELDQKIDQWFIALMASRGRTLLGTRMLSRG